MTIMVQKGSASGSDHSGKALSARVSRINCVPTPWTIALSLPLVRAPTTTLRVAATERMNEIEASRVKMTRIIHRSATPRAKNPRKMVNRLYASENGSNSLPKGVTTPYRRAT